MKASEFFSDRIQRLLLMVAFAAATAFLLLATGTSRGIVVILSIVWALIFIIGQMVDFFRCRSRLQELDAVMEGLDKKYLFAECAKVRGSVYERRLFDLFRRSGRAMVSAVSDAEALQREYREYVESFVHEIKTPITAAELVCRKVDVEQRGKLLCELAQIGAHVERALFYARTENAQKDFLVREESLGELVAQALAEYRTFLVASGVRIQVGEIRQVVFTDRKWTVFLLGQLLQNCARYRREEPVVVIAAEDVCGEAGALGGASGMFGEGAAVRPLASAGSHLVRLTVQDNGIGIPAHELPRVFDRGFTGSNGRARGGATGMGLYLCRRLADSLGIGLEIMSECGAGTTVVLTFAAKEGKGAV